MTNHHVHIVDRDTDAVIKVLGPYHSAREAEKAERGVNRQIDHANYYTRIHEENNA